MCIKGFIFDLDGTLLDSMGIWDNIGEEYLRLKGVDNIPQNMKEILKLMSLLQAAEYFIESFHINLSPHQIMDEINMLIEDKYKYHVGLKDGVHEFLEKNRELKMCIATATDKPLVEFALKRLNIYKYFEFIITSTEVGSSKQNPDIYIKAAEKLGLPLSEVAVFEDALHAIETAKSANFYTVGVYEAVFEQDKEKIKQTADCYIINLNEYEVNK
ncbi:MAG: HAD family hydrolase [Caulobacteraceae bacterium]